MKRFGKKHPHPHKTKMQLHFVAFLAFLAVWRAEAGEDKYTTKYDNVNFDEIIASERLLKNYVDCLLERGRCTPDATELKRVLPDALETDCQKCSAAQKAGIGKVVRHLVSKRRQWWDDLEARYDPSGKYAARYKDNLR